MTWSHKRKMLTHHRGTLFLKRMLSYDKDTIKYFQIEQIKHLTDLEQTEATADSFNKISQKYKEIQREDIDILAIQQTMGMVGFGWFW